MNSEMAVAVASGKPCLGRYEVPEPGPALVLQAEDPAVRVRERLLQVEKHTREVGEPSPDLQ